MGRDREAQNSSAIASEHHIAFLRGFDIEKAFAHDTATYMFLLLGMPPKLIVFGNVFSPVRTRSP